MNIFALLYFMLPAYIANMAPVFARGIFKWLAYPVDFNLKLNRRPLLGKNKTWRGLIFGSLAGVLVFLLQKWLCQFDFFTQISLLDYSAASLWIGFLLGFGALFGDLVKSFFKRRLDIMPGKAWIPFDQIDYTIGALLFASIIYFPGWLESIIIIIISALLHFITNYMGYYLHIRKQKW